MSKFYLDGSSSDEEGKDVDNLPYPAPLARNAFLAPHFDPSAYLGSLHNRHQTLEDLRSDLRTRSQELSKELLDLVNSNYQDFVNLGSSLQGGEDKVEELRLGLLGFKREIEGIQQKVKDRGTAVRTAIDEKKIIRKQLRLGRKLLDFDMRLEEIERKLLLIPARPISNAGSDDPVNIPSDSEVSEDEELSESEARNLPQISITRLKAHVKDYLVLCQITNQIGNGHPFIKAQETRVEGVRNTLLLDLNNALAQTLKLGQSGEGILLRVIALYRDMDASSSAIKTIKDTRLHR